MCISYFSIRSFLWYLFYIYLYVEKSMQMFMIFLCSCPWIGVEIFQYPTEIVFLAIAMHSILCNHPHKKKLFFVELQDNNGFTEMLLIY